MNERAAKSAVVLREAEALDIPGIARAVGGQPLMQRYGVSEDALSRSLHGALSRGEDLIVAESAPERDQPAALLGMAWSLRQGTFALGGYLRLIALVPGSEGAGVGGLLLDEVERRTLTCSRFLFLLVSAHNEGARRFYARRGYAESGALPGLLREGLDEIIMWKRLAP